MKSIPSCLLMTLLLPLASEAQSFWITTIAGGGAATFNGDGMPATDSDLNAPRGVAADTAGNVYIADTSNHRIRKVALDGIITTVAGTGIPGYNGDNIPATNANLNFPFRLAVDSSGNLYIGDSGNNRIRKVDTAGVITTLAGTASAGSFGDGGQATNAKLNFPQGIALDAAGNLYFADSANNVIRKIDTGGTITTVAGNLIATYAGDGGPATEASLNNPTSVALDASGVLYIPDQGNNVIRKVAANGTISTVAGNFSMPAGFSGDGVQATSTSLNLPSSVVVDGSGNLYIDDNANNRIRRVGTDGTITTVAGNGAPAFGGDAGAAINSSLNLPKTVAFGPSGEIFIADSGNNRVRLLTPMPAVQSVTNAASFVAGAIVPGEIATLFGSYLTSATGINLTSGLPLPVEYLNVTVKINGAAVPLFAIDNVNGQQQINFQAPWEVANQPTATIEVLNGGITSQSLVVGVLNAQPGIISYATGGNTFGVVLHANFQLADTDHPVAPGETVLIYCTGLGAVISPPEDGAAASGQVTMATPMVTVGGVSAPVGFSGLAPGFVGLNQVNVTIPTKGVASGNQPVVMTVNGTSSPAVLLPIK